MLEAYFNGLGYCSANDVLLSNTEELLAQERLISKEMLQNMHSGKDVFTVRH
jgi:hypothetical protein